MRVSSVKILGLAVVILAIVLCQTDARRKGKGKGHHHGRHHRRHHRPEPCPSGWWHHDDSCYQYVNRPLSWAGAAAHCARQGAHLVRLESDGEADWVSVRLAQLVARYWGACPAWWTAGVSQGGSWVWHQDFSIFELIIRTTRWFGGCPNAYTLPDFTVTMQISNGYFGLVARHNDTRLPFVCEKDAESEDSTGSHSRDSDRSHGHHSKGKGSHSRGSHSHSRDADRSHGHHSRGKGSHSHSHSTGTESHDSHDRRHDRRGHNDDDYDARYGGRFPDYHHNPYSPYYPRPALPDICPQPPRPTTTQPPTTTRQPATNTTQPRTRSTTEFRTTTTVSTTTEPTTTTTEQPEPCPRGWLSFADSCYQILDTCAQTRRTAQEACQLLGGHLASIDSQAEEAFLSSTLDRTKDWWISGRCEDGQCSWEQQGDSSESESSDSDSDSADSSSESSGHDDLVVFDTTSSAHYTNWHPRQPKIDGGVTFAVLDWARGKWGWKNLAGHEYKYYICEVKQHNVSQGCQTTSCQRQAAGLRDQLIWDRFLDNEYVVQDRCAKKRSDAAATCRQQGAQLVTIESSAEMRFVQRLLREKAYDMDDAPSWWTNGVYVNRRWQWQGSRTTFMYTNWGPDTDPPRGNFLVLHYYALFDKWMWTDTKASQKLLFICKRSA